MEYIDDEGKTLIDSDQILHEPEHTIQVIRSFNTDNKYDIDFENRDITQGDNTTGFTMHFHTIEAMYRFMVEIYG